MSAVGMDSLVIQYVAYGNTYYYPTSVPGGTPYGTDSIERILTAADASDVDVFLGVHFDSTPDSNNSFDLAANLAQGEATLNELQTRYASHASLAGWYMPQEISDYIVFYEPQLRDDLVSYTSSLKGVTSGLAGDLPMMISPYFGQNPNAGAYAAWWDETGLPQMGVDIVALQDGVGTHRTTIAESRPVFEALQPVLANHNVAFWANNESFDQTHGWPVDDQPWASVSTDIETFKQQIQSTTPLVDKSITFEFSSYMSPQGSAASGQLYQDYQDYYQSVTSPPGGEPRLIDIAGYAYENPATTYFNGSAPDPSNALLIDGDAGTLDGGPGSAFANGTWVGYGNDDVEGGPQPRVVFDLGGEYRVDSVELFYLVSAQPSIFAPQEIAGVADAFMLEASVDGSNFTAVASTNGFTDIATDQANSAFEIRSVTLDLGGIATSYLAVDVRTPYTWIFLSELLAYEVGSPADFNRDGYVDAIDLGLWQTNFGTPESVGDADQDGDTDGADFLIWQREVTESHVAGHDAVRQATLGVPEPAALWLLGWGLFVLHAAGIRVANRFWPIDSPCRNHSHNNELALYGGK